MKASTLKSSLTPQSLRTPGIFYEIAMISEIKVATSFPALASSTNYFKSLAKSTADLMHYTGSNSNFY